MRTVDRRPKVCGKVRLCCSLDSPSMTSAKFGGKLIQVALANWAYGKGSRDQELAMKFTQVLLVIIGAVAKANPEGDFWPYLEFQILWAQRYLAGSNEFLEDVQD